MSIPFEGRRVEVIGGAGFIGHHLALALANKGAKPYVLDSLQVNNLLSFAAPDTEVQNRELYERIIYQRLDGLRAAAIPLLVADADGRLREPFDRIGGVRVGPPAARRRRHSALRRRRPALPLRRRVGTPPATPLVHRGGYGIIART